VELVGLGSSKHVPDRSKQLLNNNFINVVDGNGESTRNEYPDYLQLVACK
jgi:hypothetical protein